MSHSEAKAQAQADPLNCPIIIVSLVLLVALSACGGTGTRTPAERRYQDELDRRLLTAEKVEIRGPDGKKAYVLPAPERIAHFKLDGERQVYFSWSPITDDVIYEEEAKDGDAPLFDPSTSMLERFVALADEHAPLPFKIVELDKQLSEAERQRLTAGRVLTTMPLETMEVGKDQVAGLPEQLMGSPAAATPSCQDASHFANTHCYYLNNSLVARNRRDAIWCCDENYPKACGYNPNQGNSSWAAIDRVSGVYRKNSFSTVVACGTSVRVEHYFWAWGGWATMGNRDQIVPANKVRTMFVMGGGWYHRRITAGRQTSNGGLRAYSEFSNAP